jgi:hypothetical protein
MKLYTEEQVRLLLDLAKLKLNGEMYSKDLLLEQVEPIELPSDEDISTQASNRHYGTNFKHIYASGAKWMKEQILNQNK